MTFTASNGISVRIEDGAPNTQALREFFQHERDEELGRWRWPENPDYVVYHARNVNGDHKVIRESGGHGMLWGRDMEPAPQSSDGLESAARAYFDAHPERKPWYEAQRDDVWLFKSETKRGLALAWRAEDSWDVIDQRGNFHSAIQDVPQEMRDHSFYGWDNPTAELVHRIERPES